MKTGSWNRFVVGALTITASLSLLAGSLSARAQGDSVLDRVSSAPIPQQGTGGDTVLVQGNPPLTERMVTRYTSIITWLLEVPLTPEQKTKLRSILIKDWKGQKPSDIQSDLSVLEMEGQLAPYNAHEREVIRR